MKQQTMMQINKQKARVPRMERHKLKQVSIMQIEKHTLLKDFPEHHHTIRHLKMHSAHFVKLFNSYHEVDSEIHQLEESNSPVDDEYMEKLKKHRLHYKDQLFSMIQQTEQAI